MKMILRADQHPCRDVAVQRLYIRIHTSIQQRHILTLSESRGTDILLIIFVKSLRYQNELKIPFARKIS